MAALTISFPDPRQLGSPIPLIDCPSNVDLNLDTRDYLSTHRLRAWFAFHAMHGDISLHPLRMFPDGPYLLMRCDNLHNFIDHFWQYLTVKQFQTIAASHNVRIHNKVPKSMACNKLRTHNCGTTCRSTTIILKALKKPRVCPIQMPFPNADIIGSTQRRNSMDHRNQQQRHRRDTQPHSRHPPIPTAGDESINNQPLHEVPFPPKYSDSRRADIIRQWQREMDPARHVGFPCAVCAQCAPKQSIISVHANDIDLTLLRNPALPPETHPTTYNFQAYDRAILYPLGLHDIDTKGIMDLCPSCYHTLNSSSTKRQPLDSLANFQYYAIHELPGPVKAAFNNASMFDLMMVARCRATRITHLFSKKKDNPQYGIPEDQSQRYNKGNVAILPQNTINLRNVLPPDSSEIAEAMCALFIGSDTKPTIDNIERLRPVLVSKNIITVLIEFLTTKNFWYTNAGVKFSQTNLDALFDTGQDIDTSIPKSIQICHLSEEESQNVRHGIADYTDRENLQGQSMHSPLTMEAVGYTTGDHSSHSYRDMKARAISWCLDRKRFVKVQSGTKAVNDRDPALLSSLFPHLDPWAIGGFSDVSRSPDQQISFERQVKNLLLQHNSPFQKDPNFAYVCWNIMQKREVNKQVSFKTKAATQHNLTAELTALAPALTDLIQKWEHNPAATATNRDEKHAINLLNRLKMVAKEIKGSSGYKLCRRNEIRALMKMMSTPALFLTLNPSDLTNPLLGVMGGLQVDDWTMMSQEQRAVFVANNPGPAAQFFDLMIKAFVDIILGYKKPNGGLFGTCLAYYAMVEAQGRGTLHCHMLIWLAGNPSPQQLRDKMAENPDFKTEMFHWIESIIKCELPDTTSIVTEPNGQPLRKPHRPAGTLDPRLKPQPILTTQRTSDEPFASQFREFVKELSIECNWHEHTQTCWKHLRVGEPHDDAHCRMRINGCT